MTQQTGYTREWLANGQVLCFHFNSLGGTTAEEWYAEMLVNYDTWRQNHHRALVLMDMRNTSNLLSAEGMARGRALSDRFSDLDGKIALLVNASENYANLEMFVERGLGSKARERQIFTDEQAALDWLVSE